MQKKEVESIVLLVDDNTVNIIVASNMLCAHGLRVDTATSGKQAIEMIKNKTYDMIFLDILMPEMDGIETTRIIREFPNNRRDNTIIAITGSTITDKEEFIKKTHFSDVLAKPMQEEQLLLCLKKWLGKDKSQILAKTEPNREVKVTVSSNSKVWDTNKEKILILRQLIKQVKGMDMEQGLIYALGDADQYVRIIKAAILAIKHSMIKLESTIEGDDIAEVKAECHAIKSVLNHLCVHQVAETAIKLEHKQGQQQKLMLIGNLKKLLSELEQAIKAYNSSINASIEAQVSVSTKEEIVKQQEKILFLVKRFEYLEIMKQLNNLFTMVPMEGRKKIKQAIAALEEFDYAGVAENIGSSME